MRKLQPSDLVGKTIKAADTNSVNVVHLTFTDGTKLDVWTEQAVSVLDSFIPGFFVEGEEDG